MRICLDIETNALINPTKIWVVVCRDLLTGLHTIYRNILDDDTERQRLLNFLENAESIIGHNILAYDWPVMVKLVSQDLNSKYDRILDTFVISKLVDFPREHHSVEDYGVEFGLEKISWHDYSKYSQELEDYCIRDVDITYKIYLKYKKYIDNPMHKTSIEKEHRFQCIVNNIENKGFTLDTKLCTTLLSKVHSKLTSLDKGILEAFPPRLKLIREVTPKETKYGTISLSSIPKDMRKDIADLTINAPFSYCHWIDFNPSSHKQIINVLNEAGWNPVAKTKTHIETEREINKLKRKSDSLSRLTYEDLRVTLNQLQKTGWKVAEENLVTLPNIDYLILWKDKCHIRLASEEGNTRAIIIKDILNASEQKHWPRIIKIRDIQDTDNLKRIMELVSRTLKECVSNKTDVAKFVESEKNLWSIIATSTDIFVDCSASFATDTWAGMRDLHQLQKTISINQSARTLAQRILHEARRRTLTEWLSLVQQDGRVHGKFQAIGAWTHRMSHQKPNMANITNEFDLAGNVKLLGKELRQCWTVPKDRLLVGVDAEGIQLRIFAHYINDPEFTDALVKGKKDDKTDPHSLNQRILGSVCRSRAAAKRFIFALLLGAGIGKLAEILGCSTEQAQEALDTLLSRYTGFALLKETIIPKDAKRGWFTGLDGRKVRILGDTEGLRRHLAMSGYLQNGEAVVIKTAAIIAEPRLIELDSYYVDIIHDEYQVETPNDFKIAKEVCEVLCRAITEAGELLGLLCPLAGSYWNDDHKEYTIGRNWWETH